MKNKKYNSITNEELDNIKNEILDLEIKAKTYLKNKDLGNLLKIGRRMKVLKKKMEASIK